MVDDIPILRCAKRGAGGERRRRDREDVP